MVCIDLKAQKHLFRFLYDNLLELLRRVLLLLNKYCMLYYERSAFSWKGIFSHSKYLVCYGNSFTDWTQKYFRLLLQKRKDIRERILLFRSCNYHNWLQIIHPHWILSLNVWNIFTFQIILENCVRLLTDSSNNRTNTERYSCYSQYCKFFVKFKWTFLGWASKWID